MHRAKGLWPITGGTVASGFESVRDEFIRNFLERGERGAACSVYFRGVKVVDLWGGYRNDATKQPWTKQTMTLGFSVTKGMAAAAMVVAHGRGYFELDEPVASYWPEFARNGKAEITVRQLLTHQAGLTSFERSLTAKQIADHDAMAELMADQRPWWTPGQRHGYHTLTLGWYQNELIRRVDPLGRTLGQFFNDEVAAPLGIDFYIGKPEHIDSYRMAKTKGFHRLAVLKNLRHLPKSMILAGAWPRSLVARSSRVLKINDPAELGNSKYQSIEIPSANGIGTARGVAQIYDVLARGGSRLGLRQETQNELLRPSLDPEGGRKDTILKIDTRYNFGFSRPSSGFPFGSDGLAFGCPGVGGSFGMADPTAKMSMAYLTNKMSFRIFNDPRERSIRESAYACIAKLTQSQSDRGQSDRGQSDRGQSDRGQSDWGQSDWGQSDWGQSDWGQSDWGQSDWGPRKLG